MESSNDRNDVSDDAIKGQQQTAVADSHRNDPVTDAFPRRSSAASGEVTDDNSKVKTIDYHISVFNEKLNNMKSCLETFVNDETIESTDNAAMIEDRPTGVSQNSTSSIENRPSEEVMIENLSQAVEIIINATEYKIMPQFSLKNCLKKFDDLPALFVEARNKITNRCEKRVRELTPADHTDDDLTQKVQKLQIGGSTNEQLIDNQQLKEDHEPTKEELVQQIKRLNITTALQNKIAALKDKMTALKDKMAALQNKIMMQNEKILDGTIFLSFENVITVGDQIFSSNSDENVITEGGQIFPANSDETDGTVQSTNDIFERSEQLDYYMNAAKAIQKELKLKEENSNSAPQGEKIDIFGKIRSNCESAHLMPRARSCAPFWYPIVPWVLKLPKDYDKGWTATQKWAALEKCIHGYNSGSNADSKSQKFDSDTGKSDSKSASVTGSKSQTYDPDTGKSHSKRASVTGSKSQKSDPDTGESDKRASVTGIKHFKTNRIRLANQNAFDNKDQKPGLLIIPILSTDDVKNWDGKSYSAIVLAAGGAAGDTASEVYVEVGATYVDKHNTSFLATENEVRDAISLLRQFVENVCQRFSASNAMLEDILKIKDSHDASTAGTITDEKLNLYQEWYNTDYKKPVHLPKANNNIQSTLGYVAVRKVTFDAFGDETNPAPDPMLLLAKVGSNYMKLHGSQMLRGCCEFDDPDDSDYDSSDALEMELMVRGWSHPKNKPPMTEFIINDGIADDNTIGFTNSNNGDTDELTDSE